MTDTPFTPVHLHLSKNGYPIEEFEARKESDLRCRLELISGIGWLEAEPLYQRLLASDKEELSDTFRICHSYVKWGDWQQEVAEIRVRMRRLREIGQQ